MEFETENRAEQKLKWNRKSEGRENGMERQKPWKQKGEWSVEKKWNGNMERENMGYNNQYQKKNINHSYSSSWH